MDSSKKKRLVLLFALLAACGLGFAWVLTRDGEAPIEDEIAQKANRLSEKAVEASSAAEDKEPPVDDSPARGVTDMRSVGSGG
ncbi:MAG: hypothetical protein D6692_07855 [Planctomycetota bacterium]|nr:MAG: hypothetical protein D6692_07855 [Planctomycetota bacterium]